MILTKTKSQLGPQDHGRKMSLRAFEFAPVEDGFVYELARGYIVVSEVPSYAHGLRVAFIRSCMGHYQVEHPEALHAILDGMECKLIIPDWDSERHPDIAVYLTAPAGRKHGAFWRNWVPDLVVEVVSDSSRDRDYTEKRDEYWSLGVKEYWIVDSKLERVLVLKRGKSQWTEKMLGVGDTCETRLLPGFKLLCRDVFAVAKEVED